MARPAVLVLGTGLQGRAAVEDLERAPGVGRIIAADLRVNGLEAALRALGASRTDVVRLDASDEAALRRAVSDPEVALVIQLLPVTFDAAVCRAAVDAGKPLVTTNYAHELGEAGERARGAGVTLMPEAGFDPGIDLVMTARAIRQFDEVESVISYGTGIPAPECRHANVLEYKISWSFAGVLRATARSARILASGSDVTIPSGDIFRPEWVHTIDVDEVGTLEAFPNGDAVAIAASYGRLPGLRHTARYTLRWPGHSAFWLKMVGLGLLDDDTPAPGLEVSPREFLRRHLEPRLHYGPGERDLAYLRVEAIGRRHGARSAVRLELAGYRDLETGLLGMNRLVGYPASIVAQMILDGRIAHAGVGRAASHIPGDEFLDELAKRGIRFVERELDPARCFVPATAGRSESPAR